MKKKAFLLLEILIALSLATIAIVPLIATSFKSHKKQTLDLLKIEKERLASWSFSEVLEKLYKNEIPCKQIPLKGNTSPIFSLKDHMIEIPNLSPKKIKRQFFLKTTGEKIQGKNQTLRQLRVYILLEEDCYEFRTPCLIQQHPLRQKKSYTIK